MPFFCRLEADSTHRRVLKQVKSCTLTPILRKFFTFFCVFLHRLPPSVSTPNFQKSTPFENLALTFFSVPPPYFRQNKHKHLYFNHLAKPLKIRLFSAKKFLAQNFRKFEGVECSLWEQIRKKINKNSETALVVLSCGEELKKKRLSKLFRLSSYETKYGHLCHVYRCSRKLLIEKCCSFRLICYLCSVFGMRGARWGAGIAGTTHVCTTHHAWK